MTEKRNNCYVWVTWLAKLMAGDMQCHWAPWFKSHYVVSPKAPSDFQPSTWIVEHNKCLAVLPDTMDGLKGMANLGQETMAGYLQNWEKARAIRLRNLIFKLTQEQLQSVEKAIDQILPEAKRQQGISPNARGTALYLICKSFADKEDKHDNS
jgi:hypothetical protein